MKIKPITSSQFEFCAEIQDIDLTKRLDTADMKTLATALMQHKVLVVREQELSTQQYAEFGRSLTGNTRIDSFTEMHVPGFDDMNQVGNISPLFEDEGYRNGAAFWHTDCAAEVDANAITMLYCLHALTENGETVFADMEAAYHGLDEQTKKQIDQLQAWHCYAGAKPVLGGREPWEFELTPVTAETQANFPDPVLRPLVRTHSVNQIRCLYAPAGSAFAIEGMEFEAAYKLMQQLKHHATQQHFCYKHQYRVGDIVIWDNTSTMHYATPTEAATGEHDKRLMYRISPLGIPGCLST